MTMRKEDCGMTAYTANELLAYGRKLIAAGDLLNRTLNREQATGVSAMQAIADLLDNPCTGKELRSFLTKAHKELFAQAKVKAAEEAAARLAELEALAPVKRKRAASVKVQDETEINDPSAVLG
jgi:hypothetical protein